MAAQPIQAQRMRGWDGGRYYGVPEQDKQSIFFDEFIDNRNGWNLSSDRLDMIIRDDEFYLESKNRNSYVKRRGVHINENENYEIEVRIRFTKGSENSETGLTFGRDFQSNEFNFSFLPSGKYAIYKYERGRKVMYKDWTASNSVSKHAPNVLTVRKVSNTWYFFLNRSRIHTMPAQKLFGKDFGFTIGGHMAIEVDYLRINEIHSKDTYGPKIALIQPRLDANQVVETSSNRVPIKCRFTDMSGIAEVSINGTEISISPEGYLDETLRPSKVGSTPIMIVAKDHYGNLTRKEFTINYRPSSAIASYQPRRPSGYAPKGKNYLLLIGINSYDSWSKLHNAVRDCNGLADVLTRSYQFDRENVFTLYNGKATRENILDTFESLQDRIRPNDNLLIYYAGHGYYDTHAGLGYWVPVDARLNKVSDFIRNSTIHDYLKTINTKHTFLIADACYAGSLFARSRGRIQENSKSRWAFTSGNIEKVWDGQPGQHSPFARYLLRFLDTNRKPVLQADELIESVGNVVKRNTAQTPQGSALQNVGDEGGVFSFIRK